MSSVQQPKALYIYILLLIFFFNAALHIHLIAQVWLHITNAQFQVAHSRHKIIDDLIAQTMLFWVFQPAETGCGIWRIYHCGSCSFYRNKENKTKQKRSKWSKEFFFFLQRCTQNCYMNWDKTNHRIFNLFCAWMSALYNELLRMFCPLIAKQTTNMREPISAMERLLIILASKYRSWFVNLVSPYTWFFFRIQLFKSFCKRSYTNLISFLRLHV